MTPEMGLVTVACRAMATRFEIALWGGEESHLRSAGEEALAEIERLDAQLSMYNCDSEISEVNAHAARRPVTVDPRVFGLLERAKALSELTDGAFDITVAPLLRAWGFVGGSGRLPSDSEVESARQVTGMALVELDPEEGTVRFGRPGVTVDLGAIGKGYAIEQAADILREAGVGGALIHGGTSTVQAIGTQCNGEPWPVAIRDPCQEGATAAIVHLEDHALSVSAVHGKVFTEADVRYGHVLNPRTGAPAQCALLSAVQCGSATESDALSTGLLVLGYAGIHRIAGLPGVVGVLVCDQNSADGRLRVHNRGFQGPDSA